MQNQLINQKKILFYLINIDVTKIVLVINKINYLFSHLHNTSTNI